MKVREGREWVLQVPGTFDRERLGSVGGFGGKLRLSWLW